ncbi:alpha/beta fold hydrolase [Streptomyces sp. NPDC057702]|uniref:alpha/beta fold hydrolase n=1 Tax=unclassified Streptomyces TaxID=2593676 RepID=UPI0036BF8676
MTPTRSLVPTAVFGPRAAAGTAHALVFAPVTPRWDDGAFFAPVTRALVRAGLRVTVVDTLALWDEHTPTLTALAARCRPLLTRHGPVDLLCGNALGGAVAQALLPDTHPDTAALLVSGPARTDALLEARLAEIADLAASGRPDRALALLGRRVRPYDHRPDDGEHTLTAPAPGAGRRLAAGMRLLRDVDLGPVVRAHPGPLLQIVGGRSQLVTPRHTVAAPHHRVAIVERAGMRPHFTHTAEVSALVGAFLREKGHP